jgi:YVTN family beta-propeller protein
MVISATFLRRSVLLAAVAALFACVTAASAAAAPRVFVGNVEHETVSVIESGTNQVIGEPVAVGFFPTSIAVTPNGRYAYVADGGSASVSVIDAKTLQTVGKPIPVGTDPASIAISPDGSRAYVADEGSKEVTVINTVTNTVAGEIEVASAPTGVAVTPSGGSVWVAEPETGVEVINVSTGKITGAPIAIEGEGKPETVVFTPDGKTAYLGGKYTETGNSEEVFAVSTATRQVTPIKVGIRPYGIAVTPDGSKALVPNEFSESVSVIDTATNQVVGEIPVGKEPCEVAITPDGKTAYVSVFQDEVVRRINLQTNLVTGSGIKVAGEPFSLAITPDQSPTAAYTPPAAVLNKPTAFSGIASSDPDGTISSYAWAFGDGGTATGVEPTHTYTGTGEFAVKLSVVDNEGCSEAEVFTGRTAYCSGGASSVTHTVTSYPPPNNFGFKRLVHNRNNGTVRMQVKLPGEGELVLTGPQVHMVRKKKAPAGLVWMTLHPRVEVGKRLKKVHHLRIRVKVKFTPVGGTTKAKSRSLQLLRRAKKKHHHG